MSSSTEYQELKITGPLNVVRRSPRELKGKELIVHILMGPTGSGKSAFIESLSDGTLSISKNTLDSVTHEVVCYQVANMTPKKGVGWQYILMDTPGFLDTKLSESRISTMIASTLEALRKYADRVIVGILYLHPITDIRLGGSKRDVVKLLRAFAESFKATGINIITTMWNTIHTPKRLADADDRGMALQDDIFRTSEEIGISVYKFEFSKESALFILDQVRYGWAYLKAPSKDVNSQFRSMARDNLLNRIGQAEQQLQLLTEDPLSGSMVGMEDQQLLESIIRSQKAEAEAALESFLDDLYALDPATYRTNFPNRPFPRPPPPPPPQEQQQEQGRSLLTRFSQFTRQSPFKGIFKKK